MARRGIITLDEAEQDMLPLNARVEKLRFKLNEADKSLEVMKQVKKRLDLRSCPIFPLSPLRKI